MSRTAKVLPVAAAVFVLSSCQFFTSLFTPGTGTLELTSYSGYFVDNPPDTSTKVGRAVLVVDPPIAKRSLFVTDTSGSLTVAGVPPGTYSVSPFGAGPEYSGEVTVSRNGTGTLTVVSPENTLLLCYLNQSSGVTELTNATARKALAESIDRSTVAADLQAEWPDSVAADSYLPASLSEGGWQSGAQKISASSGAQSTMNASGVSPFTLDLLVDSGTATRSAGVEVENAFDALSQVTVTFDEQPYESYATSLSTRTFDAVVAVWHLSTNNLLDFYQQAFDTAPNYGGYGNASLAPLITAGNKALDGGDAKAYAAALRDINDLLIDDGAAVPLLWQSSR